MDPDLTQISNKILTLLRDEAGLDDTYEVTAWPENPTDYTLTHPKGAILVVFKDWRFQDPNDLKGGTQPTGCDFQISTLNRSLLPDKQNPGAYQMIKEVYEAIHGEQFEHDYFKCRRITLVSQGNGRFHYAQQWRLPNLQL